MRQLLGQPVRELSLGERMKMELIAALLHSPEVLFLDEPTIGLDVIAQHNIQPFLRHYQQRQKMTILLTSHYMKDVAALCRRVVIIAHGQIMYDGSLAGIIDRFSSHKIVTLLFAGDTVPEGLARYGEVLEEQAPKVKLRVDRSVVAEVAGGDSGAAYGGGRERRRSAAGRSDRRDVFAGHRAGGRRQALAEQSSVRRPAEIVHRVESIGLLHGDHASRASPSDVACASCTPGGRSCGSAWKSGWSIGATSRWAR